MTPADDVRRAALVEWRHSLLEAGIGADTLPTEGDLALIAQHPDRAMFDQIGLARLEAVRRFQPGILATLRTAARVVAEAPLATASAQHSHAVHSSSAPPALATEPPAPDKTSAMRDTERPQPARNRGKRQRGQGPRQDGADQNSRRTSPPQEAPPQEPPAQEAPVPAEPAPAEPPPFAHRDIHAPMAVPVHDGLSIAVNEEGSLRITWPPAPGRCAVYRVITSDRQVPFSPEDGELLTTTTKFTELLDPRPFTGALRHVQVWLNTGPDELAARAAQPELLCQDSVVAPVRNVVLSEDHGTVTCRWQQIPSGVDRVDVVRVTAAEKHRRGYLVDRLIAAQHVHKGGFADWDVQPGETYEYRLYAVAVLDGVERMPDPVVRTVRVAAPLEPVTDLRATTRSAGQGQAVDLEWTAPGNETVVLYRTENAAEAGAEDEVLTEGGLAGAGLDERARLNQPVAVTGTHCRLNGVPWPAGWVRVHFTPVSLSGGQARVGRGVTLSRTGSLRNVLLVQRVDWQLLTFSWPEGATQVQVFVTVKGRALPEPPGQPQAQLGREDYDRLGGLRLRDVLPDEGCDVHVIPVTYFAGGALRGSGAVLPYNGLARLRYRLVDESGMFGRFLQKRRRIAVEVMSEQMASAPELVLIHNPHQLPLDPGDGTVVVSVPATAVTRGAWSRLTQLEVERDRPGWYRLFADLQGFPGDYAVLDPPIDTLRGAP